MTVSVVLDIFRRPAVRYLIVGGSTNFALIIVYVFLAARGIVDVLASSIVFVLGVLISYVFNKGWSFRDTSSHKTTFMKYALTYSIGYIVQIGVLYVAVYCLGIHHIIGQVIAMLASAVSIYLQLKLFVFRNPRHGA